MLDLAFRLKPSKNYILFMLTVLVLSIIIILVLPFDLGIKCLGLLLSCGYGSYVVRQFGLLQNKHSITAIQRQNDGCWILHTNKKTYHAKLSGDSTVTSLVSILRFRIPSRLFKKTCIILSDSLHPDDYRRLLIALKMN